MTWDGIPEHRNLRGDHESGTAPLDPEQRKAYIKRIVEASGRTDATPPAGEMPPDPFSGTLPGAIAQAEMLHSLIEAGFTEPQALYYLACLVQAGLAMRMGRFTGELPEWPERS